MNNWKGIGSILYLIIVFLILIAVFAYLIFTTTLSYFFSMIPTSLYVFLIIIFAIFAGIILYSNIAPFGVTASAIALSIIVAAFTFYL